MVSINNLRYRSAGWVSVLFAVPSDTVTNSLFYFLGLCPGPLVGPVGLMWGVLPRCARGSPTGPHGRLGGAPWAPAVRPAWPRLCCASGSTGPGHSRKSLFQETADCALCRLGLVTVRVEGYAITAYQCMGDQGHVRRASAVTACTWDDPDALPQPEGKVAHTRCKANGDV